MANNVFGGRPNAVVCKTTTSFASAGITALNTLIIYLVDNPLLSYVPGRAINGITGFVADKGYYMVMLSDMDLTAIVVPPTAGAGYSFVNTEAASYFTRLATAGYASNDTEKGAYDAFVSAAKTNSYYTKLKAMWLFLGAADSPRLLNAISSSFTGVKWTSGVTFSSAGVAFDGTAGHIKTTFAPSTNMTNNDTAFGCWPITNMTEVKDAMGSADDGTHQMTIIAKDGSGNFTAAHYNPATAVSMVNSNSSGFFVSSRTSSTLMTNYRNATSLGTETAANTVTPPAWPFSLGANASSASPDGFNFSANSYKMFFLSSGLSGANVTAFFADLGTLMTALGR